MIKLSGTGPRNQVWDRLNSITPSLAKKDPSLWGVAASIEAAVRLDWVDLPESSRELLPTLDALSAWSRELGHSHFILCGMGGSSLAPEVIAAHFNKKLTVLDSTDPNQINDALSIDLTKSCIIVASKSGGTVETASQRALFQDKLVKAGLDPKNHLVIITDPGSPLYESAVQDGLRVITANPKVGGRFSALSAFGLTPAALLGIDVSVLLDDASDAASSFTAPDSPVVAMAELLARDAFRFARFFDGDSPYPGLADWIEQLVAESTGKDGKGVLPVVLHSAPHDRSSVITFTEGDSLSVTGPLGAQFIFWEWVTALLCYLIEVDPFNQPNVAESKDRTNSILNSWSELKASPRFESASLQVFTSIAGDSLSGLLKELARAEYLGIMAYLNRNEEIEIIELQELLEAKLHIPITFGWGPRFLHSTGQFHKGGPLTGSFLQITGAAKEDLPIPGKDFGFERLILAQALGDYEALTSRELPVIRLHLKDRVNGIAELLSVANSL